MTVSVDIIMTIIAIRIKKVMTNSSHIKINITFNAIANESI
jgi:hypothetical protein